MTCKNRSPETHFSDYFENEIPSLKDKNQFETIDRKSKKIWREIRNAKKSLPDLT
jgi:hypothetical protein